MRALSRLASASLVLLVVLSAARTASCQELPLRDLDALVEHGMSVWDVPGLAITIVKDDRVVLAKGYGVRELGKSAPVNEETIFDMAPKTFLTFTFNEAGDVEGFTVTFYDPTHFERVREKQSERAR
ncbi:MAG: serine hydrolase domain-containing protein [Planctomycetota bacterium]